MNIINEITTTIYLASSHGGFDGKVGSVDFWNTSIGSTLRTLMGVVGILVVIYAILKGVKNVATGKVGDSIKGIVGAVLLAAVLFNPPLIQKAVAAGGSLVESVIDTVAKIGDGSGSTPTPAPVPAPVPATVPVPTTATPSLAT